MENKMTLAEAFLILKNKEEALKETVLLRDTSLYNVYKRINGQKELIHEEHEFSVDELVRKIEKLEKEIRKLRLIITNANIRNLVDFTVEDEQITLQEAIYLVKQYRNQLPRLKEMGEMKSRSQIVDPTPRYAQLPGAVDRSYEEVTEPSFNTKQYRKKAEKIEILITKLEVAINQANYSTYVDLYEIELKQL